MLPAACLFDLDGLLIDTEPLHGQAWRQAAAQFGIQLSDEQLIQLRGRRRQNCAEKVLSWITAQNCSPSGSFSHPPTAEQLLTVRQPLARQLLPKARAIMGAPELLERCRQLKLAMALVTSSGAEAVALKAAPHPWLELLELRVYGDDPELMLGKPYPDPYLLAARRLGVDPSDCWAFEDSPAGAQSAMAAGCRVHVLAPPNIGEAERERLFGKPWRFLTSLQQVTFD
jgi:pseudouridine-5'-monophosphatase